jgi:outer membrane biosynthesis protein TonB
MASLRTRSVYILGLALFIMLLMSYSWRTGISIADVDVAFNFSKVAEPTVGIISTPIPSAAPEADPGVKETAPEPPSPPPPPPPPPPPEPPAKEIPDHPTYKPDRPPAPVVIDNFPVAAAAHSAADLPSIPPCRCFILTVACFCNGPITLLREQ